MSHESPGCVRIWRGGCGIFRDPNERIHGFRAAGSAVLLGDSYSVADRCCNSRRHLFAWLRLPSSAYARPSAATVPGPRPSALLKAAMACP